MSVKAGLSPIAPPDARLFVLGSLPGDASLAAGRYYAHPTNQFWRLMGHVLEVDLASQPYECRLQRMAEFRVGLWDVIASADRRGSLDQAIRNAAHNPIAELVDDYPDLRAIAFNGSAAATAGRKLLAGIASNLIFLDLPSSSAANARSFETKARNWEELRSFL